MTKFTDRKVSDVFSDWMTKIKKTFFPGNEFRSRISSGNISNRDRMLHYKVDAPSRHPGSIGPIGGAGSSGESFRQAEMREKLSRLNRERYEELKRRHENHRNRFPNDVDSF